MAMEAAELGIWCWTLQKNPETGMGESGEPGSLHWDRRMFQLFGISEELWQGTYKNFADCLDQESLELVNQRIAICLKTGLPYDYAFRLKTNGHLIRGKGKLFYDKDGKPERMVGVCLRALEHEEPHS